MNCNIFSGSLHRIWRISLCQDTSWPEAAWRRSKKTTAREADVPENSPLSCNDDRGTDDRRYDQQSDTKRETTFRTRDRSRLRGHNS